MPSTGPLGYQKLPHHNEASSLRSKRDGDVVNKQWKKNKTDSSQMFRLVQEVSELRRMLNRLRIRKGGGDEDASEPRIIVTGEYDAERQYYQDQMTIFTPSGGSAGVYWCVTAPPVGTAPDTGAPYWLKEPNEMPGVWG